MTGLPPATTRGVLHFCRRVGRTVVGFSREHPLGAAAALVLLAMLVLGIVGPWITPHDPAETNIPNLLQPPSSEHWLGTDAIGRDLASRLMAGARTAVLIGFTAAFVGTTVGTLLGIVSGYAGRWVDILVQRVMDAMMAFPFLILAVAVVAVIGSSITNVIAVIAFLLIPRANRVSRSITLSVREREYVEGARALGAGPLRIIFPHVLPQTMSAFIVVLTLAVGQSILAEASLGFLGLGVPPPDPSWGRELHDGQDFFRNAPHLVLYPGIVLALAVFAANIFGDALRDKLDPHSRSS